jgi:hypothetical protein
MTGRIFRAKCSGCGKELPIWADTWENAMWLAGQQCHWRFRELNGDADADLRKSPFATIQNVGTSWYWYMCTCGDCHLEAVP